LRLDHPHEGLCLVLGLSLEEPLHHDVGAALVREALRRERHRRVEALCWDREDSALLRHALEETGFVLHEEKLYVERHLGHGSLPCPADPFSYASLEICGEEAFVATLAQLEGPPVGFSPREWARQGYAELVALAGSAFQPAHWLLATRDGQVAGLLLPQRFPDQATEGTLFYMGLLPAWRGKGLGAVIHARGLAELAVLGVTRYLGSTPSHNQAMIQVFSRNGCQSLGLRRSYLPPSS